MPVGATSEKATLGSGTCHASGDAATLLARVEKRVTKLTGLPSHANEEPLLLTRQLPAADAPILDGSKLHHDRINELKANRVVTVLAYLDTVEDAHGGHTIFPTLPCADAMTGVAEEEPLEDGRAQALDELSEAVAAAFARGARSLGCVECAQHAATQPTESEDAAAHHVLQHAEGECWRALEGRAHALAVRPERGDALVWWSALPNGTSDARVWHAGCVGRSGSGRVAMQKFKTPMASNALARLAAEAPAWRERMRADAEGLKMRARRATVAPSGAGDEYGGEEAFDEEAFWARTEHAMAKMFED